MMERPGQSHVRITRLHLESALVKNDAGATVLPFYYLDASEDEIPGTVYLFGKIFIPIMKTYISCCVVVTNIPKRIFVLPNRPSGYDLESLGLAFPALANQYGVTHYSTRAVTKNYAFHMEGVPHEAGYLQVEYPPSCPTLPQHGGSQKAILHIFGTTASTLEILLTDRGIKGPSWLEIHNVEFNDSHENITWCKSHVLCRDMQTISVMKEASGINLEIPPLITTVVNIRTRTFEKVEKVIMIHTLTQKNLCISGKSSKTSVMEEKCFMFAGLVNAGSHFLAQATGINVFQHPTIQVLLEAFLNYFTTLDPDILLGYDCEASWRVLLNGVAAIVPVPNDSRIGRIKKDMMKLKRLQIRTPNSLLHRPLCDIKVALKEVNPKLLQGEFDTVCSNILRSKVATGRPLAPWKVIEFFNSAKGMIDLIQTTRIESDCILQVTRFLNIIPLMVEMTKVAGYILSKTPRFLRNDMNDFMLTHAFYEAGYILPDRKENKVVKDIPGGLVLDANVAFYDNIVLLMDYKSLYPSIIREYNLCFSTMPGVCYKKLEDVQVDPRRRAGVIPKLVERIIQNRAETKRLMESPFIPQSMKLAYETQQLALKLIVNTLYGCLGSVHFRYYAPNLAATITKTGRECLKMACTIAESLGYGVIYGDTDSMMIDTKQKDLDIALKIADGIRDTVQTQYDHIQLEHERTYKYVLVANRKLYTGLYFTRRSDGSTGFRLESKGKLLKDTYSCELVKTAVYYVLNEVFSDQTHEEKLANIKTYLQGIAGMKRHIMLDAFIPSLVTTHRLIREPEAHTGIYAPHADLAMRLNKTAPNTWREGDSLSYIICEDGTDNPPEKRSYLTDTKFRPDMEYYLSEEVLPPLVHLFKPIPELQLDFLASCLEVSPEQKHRKTNTLQSDAKEPATVEGFFFKCRKCKTNIEMCGFFRKEGLKYVPVLVACPEASCDRAPWQYVDGIIDDLAEHLFDFMVQHPPNTFCISSKCDWVARNDGDKLRACPKCKLLKSIRTDLSVPACYARVTVLRQWFNCTVQREEVKADLTPEIIEAYQKVFTYLTTFLDERNVSDVDTKRLVY
ncbi:DNA polymerase alpha catalytic subunit-like [Diachasmimorpha longicaudata]|uniref:DNA polymerase alpha catalytic subunit-like n=1 Tax=Diachasmimorpha longicaudata TaxID=58733 RepID=UPI0030B872A3